jgi:hypothetical protein
MLCLIATCAIASRPTGLKPACRLRDNLTSATCVMQEFIRVTRDACLIKFITVRWNPLGPRERMVHRSTTSACRTRLSAAYLRVIRLSIVRLKRAMMTLALNAPWADCREGFFPCQPDNGTYSTISLLHPVNHPNDVWHNRASLRLSPMFHGGGSEIRIGGGSNSRRT